MRGRKNILFILVALVFALVSSVIVFSHIKGYEQKVLKESEKTVAIVTAERTIEKGEKITRSMVGISDWPKKQLPEGYITKRSDVIGKVVGGVVAKGLPITEDSVATSGTEIASLVPANKRAVSLRFASSDPDIAFVQPGSYVDILASFKEKDRSFVKTILQAVKVIAVDGETGPVTQKVKRGQYVSLTMLVDPEHVEMLALTKLNARMHVSLRNDEDVSLLDTVSSMVAWTKKGFVFGEDNIAAEEKGQDTAEQMADGAQKITSTVTVIRGSHVEEVEVSEDKPDIDVNE